MLTEQDIESNIASCEYMQIGKKTTGCLIILKNGFEVFGTSACVDANAYDLEIGSKFARQRALDKVWEVMGYHQQETGCCKAPDVTCNESAHNNNPAA